MRVYRLQNAWLTNGWAQHVEVSVDDAGMIAAIATTASDQSAERIDGFVIPGMPNSHSHAFQRAMIGDTEFSRSNRDSFWTWRNAMYALANRVQPEDLEVIATQLFIEMLKAGYTSVAEFHYLHRDVGGTAYQRVNPLHAAIIQAARRSGIGLTLLPTLYQWSDFGDKALRTDQNRFELSVAEFIECIGNFTRQFANDSLIRCGAAFHSLRAVNLSTMAAALTELRRIDARMPIHIHVAEQLREVNDCQRETGKRPVELLLDAELMTSDWCLVHATHATREELSRVAQLGASICVCTTTEANLGDGFFDAKGFLGAGGRICVGSDSQSSISPAEELRWMEYQQRLRHRRRAVLTDRDEMHVGARLWREAAASGARALAQPIGALQCGARADWLVLDPGEPALAGASSALAMDRLIFTATGAGIRDVMVGGRWVIKNHRHELQESVARRFVDWMRASAR